MPAPLYIDVAAVRACGLGNPPYTDAAITAAIQLAQRYVERATRQWFWSKPCAFSLDGVDADTIHFPIAIISIDTVMINDMTVALDPSYYRVYNSSDGPQDDRLNPRISLIDVRSSDTDIFTAPMVDGKLFFWKGRQNQYIAGNFGYVEPDGSVPPEIQRAVLLLAIQFLTSPPYIDPSNPPGPPPPPALGPIVEEGTDGHYIKYAQAGGATRAKAVSAWAGITSNPEVLTILKMFRAPIFISAPATPRVR